jgi:hypothetical protein
MSAPTTVHGANVSLRYTVAEACEGRAALEALGPTHIGALVLSETITLDSSEAAVAVLTGSSAGVVLPTRHSFRNFKGFALNVVSTQAQFDALGSDAIRDTYMILGDAEAPIGSTYQGIGFVLATGVVNGSKLWHKTAADTWTAMGSV